MLDHNGKVSTSLDGVRVLFEGSPAPRTYVSGNRINAVVPSGNPPISVSMGNATSPSGVTVPVQ